MNPNIGIKNMNDIFLFSSKKRSCCDISGKYKVINNSNQDVISQHTNVRRNVDTILYSLGGRTQYGFRQTQRIIRVLTFLERVRGVLGLERHGNLEIQGKREGQPGGIFGPIKNKF
jgi:hypothetical protein